MNWAWWKCVFIGHVWSRWQLRQPWMVYQQWSQCQRCGVTKVRLDPSPRFTNQVALNGRRDHD